MSKDNEGGGQLTEQIHELEHQITRLSGFRQQLLERLCLVTRDDPEVTKVDKPPMVTLVPMASDVRSLVGRVSMECDFLESLLCMLEL